MANTTYTFDTLVTRKRSLTPLEMLSKVLDQAEVEETEMVTLNVEIEYEPGVHHPGSYMDPPETEPPVIHKALLTDEEGNATETCILENLSDDEIDALTDECWHDQEEQDDRWGGCDAYDMENDR